MSLSKEVLHSPLLEEVLKNFQENLEPHGGLTPSEFEEEDLTLLYELGYNLYQGNEFAKAATIFQRLVISKPFEPRYWQAFGSCLHMQKKYQEALTPWSMWCLIDEDNPYPHFHAAESLFSLGEIEEGLKALEAANNRDQKNVLADKIEGLRLAWRTYGKN
jgi:type III secretion system low calcium response chaperone LcrH/SycD